MSEATFRGGVHPYEGKELSKDLPIKTVMPKGDMVFPMSQHIGAPATYQSERDATKDYAFFIVKQSGVYPLIDNIEKTLKRDHYDALCLKALATKLNLLKEQIMVTGMMSTFFPDYYSETSLLIAVLQISLARIKSDKQIYSFA